MYGYGSKPFKTRGIPGPKIAGIDVHPPNISLNAEMEGVYPKLWLYSHVIFQWRKSWEYIEISRASKYANVLVFPYIFRQSQVADTARLSHKPFRQSKVYPDQISQFLKWKGSPSLTIHWFINNHMWWGNKNLHISWLSISIHIWQMDHYRTVRRMVINPLLGPQASTPYLDQRRSVTI